MIKYQQCDSKLAEKFILSKRLEFDSLVIVVMKYPA